ncbi:hypothetical protein CKAH01_16632 [Colletotrichum kahawae]|uniref:Uncharacterized protein n=1 Tax=Colletotrichum kahawae TaxID=34407 RepID=A0AAE0D621_COLKA|nr:hypothetical protein CKAH01_16632 [Colletotrichum kahawae]
MYPGLCRATDTACVNMELKITAIYVC